MDLRASAVDIGMKTMNVAHRTMLTITRGKLGGRIGPMPVVELHTIGRASGTPRRTLLTAPIVEDGRVVLVASKGGDDRDPDWYRNLVAEPRVRLTIDGTTTEYTARTASVEEKAEMWPRIVGAYRGYAGYQRRTTRDIPVVICEPHPS